MNQSGQQACAIMYFSHFLSLPDVIVLDIFNDWLKVADMGRLDSTFCTKKARSQFLTHLSASQAFINHDSISSPKEYLISVWSLKRAVKVDGFTISSKLLWDNDKLLDALFALNGPSIRWIAFEDCDRGEKLASSVAKVVQNCPNTETLHLHNDFASSAQCDKCYPQLTQAFHRLHTLNIEHSKMSSRSLSSMFQHCSMLRALRMLYSSSPLPVEVALPLLEQFSAQHCDIPEAVLFAIAANCPRMKRLIIFENKLAVTDSSVVAILQGCPLLQYTDVEFATGKISHELRVKLTRHRSFTELCFDYHRWRDATPELWEVVMSMSPNLKRLSVSDRALLTDDALAVCAQHCKSLESLYLGNCSAVTAAGILAITAPENKLKKITFVWCSGLGDEAVLAVAQRCPHLTEFQCPDKVSTEAIVALAKGCPLLEEVKVNGTKADDAALTALCQHCPQLRILNAAGCQRVSQKAREVLMVQYPKLKIW